MKKYFAAALLAVVLVALAIPALAWFGISADWNGNNPPTLTGKTGAAFFSAGDGSKEYPYIIAEPVQLYNMAWLQYIGYFNLRKGANNGRAQSYFKIHDDVKTLDMTGYVLPPVGTTQYPFHGNFDGNGCVITGLTTANLQSNDTITQYPDNAKFSAAKLLATFDTGADEVGQIIGFFGVIGDYNGSVAATSTAIDTSAITAKNFALANYTVRTDSTTTTVGLAAGYVNALLEGIAIADGTVNVVSATGGAMGTDTNISDYALVGYCTTAYQNKSEHAVTVFNPKTDDSGSMGTGPTSNWGGSVAMDDLFTSLSSARNDNNPMTDYAHQAVKVMSADGSSFCGVERLVEKNAKWVYSDASNLKNQYSVVYTGGNNTVTELMMLAGGAMVSTVVCNPTTEVLSSTQYQVFNIQFGDDYLNVDVSGGPPTIVLEPANSGVEPTTWVIDTSDKSLFVLTNGCKLYVNASGTVVSFSYLKKTTGWSYVPSSMDENGEIADEQGLSYGGRYLKLINGNWELRNAADNTAYFIIKSGNNYLINPNRFVANGYPQSGYLTDSYYTTDVNDEAIERWYMSPNTNVDGCYNVYVKSASGQPLYLVDLVSPSEQYDVTYKGFVLNPQVENQVFWYYDKANKRLYNNAGNYVAYNNNTNEWGLGSSANAATVEAITPPPVTEEKRMWTLTTVTDTVYDMSYDTTNVDNYNFEFGVANKYDASYIPLQKNDNGTPTNINSGYITSGMYDQIKGMTPSDIPQENTGDVRSTEFYTRNVSDHDNVYVWNPTANAFQKVSTTATSFAEGTLGATLNRYLGANGEPGPVDEYNDLLDAESGRLYGIQFVNGIISTSSLITIPQATINGVTYQNYQVPADCIDFTLKQQGYINFFAGTYYPRTNSFFSLHHIIRDANQKITAIKEIELIYEKTDGSYFYTYKNETATVPAGATLVFDTAWLTSPNGIVTNEGNVTNQDNQIQGLRGETYYFEIPVNAGEYALGSVEGKTGACLLYLDIGASIQQGPVEVRNDSVTEIFEVTLTSEDYIDGVCILTDGTKVYDFIKNQKFSLSLTPGFKGILDINMGDAGITYTPTDNDKVVLGTYTAMNLYIKRKTISILGDNNAVTAKYRVTSLSTITRDTVGNITAVTLDTDSITVEKLNSTTGVFEPYTSSSLSTTDGVTTLTGSLGEYMVVNWSEITPPTGDNNTAVQFQCNTANEDGYAWTLTATKNGDTYTYAYAFTMAADVTAVNMSYKADGYTVTFYDQSNNEITPTTNTNDP